MLNYVNHTFSEDVIAGNQVWNPVQNFSDGGRNKFCWLRWVFLELVWSLWCSSGTFSCTSPSMWSVCRRGAAVPEGSPDGFGLVFIRRFGSVSDLCGTMAWNRKGSRCTRSPRAFNKWRCIIKCSNKNIYNITWRKEAKACEGHMHTPAGVRSPDLWRLELLITRFSVGTPNLWLILMLILNHSRSHIKPVQEIKSSLFFKGFTKRSSPVRTHLQAAAAVIRPVVIQFDHLTIIL